MKYNLFNKRRDPQLSKHINYSVLIYCIYIVQLSIAVIIYNLPFITDFYLFWIWFYYILSLVCALPQTGFSDIFGRKRHLLISAVFVLLSILYLFFMYMIEFSQAQMGSFYGSLLAAGPVCFSLGVMGNFIPIARGGIADVKTHDFRAAIGLSTTCIGLGWITAVGLGLILSPFMILIITAFLQSTVFFSLKYLFYDPEDSSLNQMESPSNFFHTIVNSYGWFGRMFLVAGGSAALLAYLFSESVFYPIYSLNEEVVATFSSKIIGVSMAIGYGAGVFFQWRFQCRDKTSIRLGVLISFISLILLSVYKALLSSFFLESRLIIESLLDFSLAFGFGFFVPSLFSMLISNIDAHHTGRLFGAIDTTDTVALSISAGILWLKEVLKINEAIVYILLTGLFLISCCYYKFFIKKFKVYVKTKRKKDFSRVDKG